MKKKSRFSGRIPPVLKTCRNAANRANMVSADTYIKGAERTVRELTTEIWQIDFLTRMLTKFVGKGHYFQQRVTKNILFLLFSH